MAHVNLQQRGQVFQSRPSAQRDKRDRRSGASSNRFATKPSELERFIDQRKLESVQAHASRATLPASSYSVSNSWDAMSMDMRPFSRFDENNTLTSATKPTGCAGARVLELEGHDQGGIFGRPATEPGRIQWTLEQEATRVLVPDNPFVQLAGGSTGVSVEKPYFNSRMMVVPKVQTVRPPTCMSRAGPQGDNALLTPEERRQINEYETKMQSAMRLGRKAQHQKTRLEYILKRRHPEGAIGVDSPSNPFTEVHADTRKRRQGAEDILCWKTAARKQRLDAIEGDSTLRFGYDPWQHRSFGADDEFCGSHPRKGSGEAAERARNKNGGEIFMQAKAGPRHAGGAPSAFANGSSTGIIQGQANPMTGATARGNLVPYDTHQRIFEAGGRQSTKSDPRFRAQQLWDEGLGRRNYNIVSSIRPPIATVTSERPAGYLSHPSQQSLERGRNLQGSLIPV